MEKQRLMGNGLIVKSPTYVSMTDIERMAGKWSWASQADIAR